MRLGAQIYSVRKYIQTQEGYLAAMKELKTMGYETIQHAGTALDDAYLLRDMTQEAGLRQICPNIDAKPLIEDPKRVIEQVRVLGCDSIMLPYITPNDMVTLESFLTNWAPLEKPVQMLLDAGITPAYHNHDFDIAPVSDWDGSFVEYLMEHKTGWKFIYDVAWGQYAGVDTLTYLEKLGDRLDCVHFKDYTSSVNSRHMPIFCACGRGIVPLDVFAEKVKQLGVQDVIVEQDNAQDYPQPFGQMQASAGYLKSIF